MDTTQRSEAESDNGKVATAEQLAELEFEPEAIDLKTLPSARTINDPFMITVRIAAVLMTKSKAELVSIVRDMGGDKPDGGDMPDIVEKLYATQSLFEYLLHLTRSAEARLLSANSVIAVEDGWAHLA